MTPRRRNLLLVGVGGTALAAGLGWALHRTTGEEASAAAVVLVAVVSVPNELESSPVLVLFAESVVATVALLFAAALLLSSEVAGALDEVSSTELSPAGRLSAVDGPTAG